MTGWNKGDQVNTLEQLKTLPRNTIVSDSKGLVVGVSYSPGFAESLDFPLTIDVLPGEVPVPTVAREQLEKLDTGPKTAREALELAWELAHPVKEGKVWPEGAQGLSKVNGEFLTFKARYAYSVDESDVLAVRSLDPLPEPGPDWLDAPAVLARVDGWVSCADPQVFARHDYYDAPSEWRYNGAESYPWQDLRDVTPLYPKGQDA